MRSEFLILLAAIGAAVAIGVYVQGTTTDVRRALPSTILEQQIDASLVVQDISNLVRSFELARLDPGPVRRAQAQDAVNAALVRLESMREAYRFDNLIGVSRIHAVASPALEDIQRWLSSGVSGYGPNTPLILNLAYSRARQAHERTRELIAETNQSAVQLIDRESERLERFRNSLQIYLGGYALFTVLLLLYYVRQRIAQTALDRERELLTDSIESIGEGFALYDAADRLVLFNARFLDMYPDPQGDSPRGMTHSEFVRSLCETGRVETVADHHARLAEEWETHHRDPGTPFEMRLSDGRWIRVSERPTGDGGAVSTHTDITDLKLAEQRLKHLATHDSLTGLPNRDLFQDRLSHAIAQAVRRDSRVAVIFFDLDRFKLVNDTYGHASGDALLKAVAERLNRSLRGNDTVARLGGDEFAAVLESVQGWHDTSATAERALKSISKTLALGRSDLEITTSAGIAMFPGDGDDVMTLMKHADAACYHAKADGRDNFKFFTREMNAEAAQRLDLEKRLRRALRRGDLSVYYQPQWDLANNRVVGMEALARWIGKGSLGEGPSRFIPVAEESGLIRELGELVLRHACTQNRAWRDAGLAVLPVAVNLSPRQFQQEDLADTIARVLADTGLEPQGLELEITETALMHDVATALNTMHRLGEMGIRLSVDDFGVGYSSLAALKQFPIDTLKIDHSFIRDITFDANDLAIVNAVIAMAHELSINVIAEGVETPDQVELLQKCGCDYVQGYLLTEPLPAEAAAGFLHPGYVAASATRRRAV